MSDDLSSATPQQLEVWAFGREGVVTDRELAEAALRELARRADHARASTRVAEEAPSSTPAADPEPREAEETEALRTHRRRMRTTGLAGLTAAAVGLLLLTGTLTLPNDDPLAIFERAESDVDREWQVRLERDFVVAITQGPRVVDLGDGISVVAFRSAAVADGRSSEFDPYCLVTIDGTDARAASAFGGTCTLPERFASDGIALPVRPSLAGNGFDTVTWGPIGQPRLDSGVALESIAGIRSVLDWMVYPDFGGTESPLAIVDDSDRVVLGPTIVPLNANDEAAALASAGAVWAYLVDGHTTDAGPVFCAHVDVADAGPTTSCAPLSAVRRQGLRFSITADGREWQVQIGADGDGRTDRIVAAD